MSRFWAFRVYEERTSVGTSRKCDNETKLQMWMLVTGSIGIAPHRGTAGRSLVKFYTREVMCWLVVYNQNMNIPMPYRFTE